MQRLILGQPQDALSRFLSTRTEEPNKVKEYIREMFYRDSAGLEQVEPEIWFNAPKGWKAPREAEQVYQQLSGDTDHALQVREAASPNVGEASQDSEGMDR